MSKIPRYSVVGGRNGLSEWYYLDKETEIQGFRFYLQRETRHGETEIYWAADFKLRGIVTHRHVRLYEDREAGQQATRREAWAMAKHRLSEMPVPAPTTLFQGKEPSHVS